jgi:2-phospho-L-lactate guanylyltransferase
MKITALIPVKGFRNAKQRLSALLTGRERAMLAEAMYRDVLRQVMRAPSVVETFIVTADGEVADIGKSFNAKVIWEKSEKGETNAVEFARVRLKEAGHEAAFIIPGDLPLVRTEDIEQVLSQAPENATEPFALLVPSHDRMGTNALLLAPPDIIKLRFGYDSFSYHMSQVRARGLPIRFYESERIALDIDEPKNLERFLAYEHEGEAFRLARRLLTQRETEKKRCSGGA